MQLKNTTCDMQTSLEIQQQISTTEEKQLVNLNTTPNQPIKVTNKETIFSQTKRETLYTIKLAANFSLEIMQAKRN